jgi:hypothetical protein
MSDEVPNIISLGAGVQSSCMALMAAAGEIGTMNVLECVGFNASGVNKGKRMTKHEHFNQLMKLCRVETVFIASVTDSVKIKYTKLPSRNGFKEYAVLQTDGRPPIVVWPEHWSQVKGKIVIGTPLLFFVNYPSLTGRQHKPELKNGAMTYPPLFQWVLDEVQSVEMIDGWMQSCMNGVDAIKQTKGSQSDE